MNDPKRRFFSGDTLQQALIQAANHHGLDPEEIAYRSLEKRHGFLKVRRRVVIEVDPDAPRREATAVAAAPALAVQAAPGRAAEEALPQPPSPPLPASPRRREPEERDRRDRRPPRGRREERRRDDPAPFRRRSDRERDERRERAAADAAPGQEAGLVTLPERPRRISERFPQAAGPAADAAREGIALLLEVAGLDLAAEILQSEERLEVDLQGPDADRCFEQDGELLVAIEHLLPRLVRTLSGETVHVRVDCDNFHEIREEQLRTLAQRVAEEVRRRGRSKTLEPMNPADRRVIHMTLADDPGVVTESDGEGYFKRVTVRPV